MTHKLFADECFTNSDRDTVPDSVIDLFTTKKIDNESEKNEDNVRRRKREEDEIKFVTGADIAQIVTEALNNLTDEEIQKPLELNKWKNALEEVIDDDTMQTQGSSSANLDAIAACYIRLLRRGFVPVNDEVLFTKNDYCGSKGCVIDRKDDFKEKTYDQMLYSVIRTRINGIASDVEKIEQKKDCGF